MKCFWQLNCVLMLNGITWNRTICIKMDLVLNNLQRLICHKIQLTNQLKALWSCKAKIINTNINHILQFVSKILYKYWLIRDIGPAVRVFANGPGDLGSIPGRVIPKTLKMVLDTTLLNTQHYKVRFKGKVEQSWEWSSALPYTLV